MVFFGLFVCLFFAIKREIVVTNDISGGQFKGQSRSWKKMPLWATVRVFHDAKDKRKFTRKTLMDFPEQLEDLEPFKESILAGTKELFSTEAMQNVEDMDIGYIGASNNKVYVRSSDQVCEAYESRFSHKNDELVLFVEQKKKLPRKRKISDSLSGKLFYRDFKIELSHPAVLMLSFTFFVNQKTLRKKTIHRGWKKFKNASWKSMGTDFHKQNISFGRRQLYVIRLPVHFSR